MALVLRISEYDLEKFYPEKLEGTMPTIEEIEERLSKKWNFASALAEFGYKYWQNYPLLLRKIISAPNEIGFDGEWSLFQSHMKPVSIAHEAYFIFTSNYLEFCIKQDTDLIRNIIQFLKLVASCNLLLLAKINLLTIQFRELALEHEFMLLLSLLDLFVISC